MSLFVAAGHRCAPGPARTIAAASGGAWEPSRTTTKAIGPRRRPVRSGGVDAGRTRSYAPQGIRPVRGGAGPGHAGSVNASEFAFLAVGMILGVATGAALVIVLRARPPAPREVRLTISPDAVPRRRGTTLAGDAFALATMGAAPGGPTDYETGDPGGGRSTVLRRTPVRSGSSIIAAATPTMVGFRVEPGHDPVFRAMAHAASDTNGAPERAIVGTAVAVLEPEDELLTQALSDDGLGATGGSGPEPLSAVDLSGPCGETRHVANERCELAARARAGVGVADETLRSAQRAYDLHVAKAGATAAETDPAMVRSRKEGAQAVFRDARNRAGSPEAIEAAARDWLGEINRINTVVKDAGGVAEREREAAAAIAPSLERLALEADAARIKAEAAEVACTAARQSVADCVEAQEARDAAVRAAAAPVAVEPDPYVPNVLTPIPAPTLATPGPRPSGPAPAEIESDPLAAALDAGQAPVIFLLLRGNDGAMARTVARLSDDPAERRRWQAALADLVEAIIAVAISQSTLDFPANHYFWGPFTREQDRDIVTALSSLGFRFDGLGGWVDDRVPAQRDLSMAMGYAGLDPMRIRQWPTEAEMRTLLADLTVAADEHLAGAASDLTLGELVAMLGRRADGLAMLWNDWGRIRPLLLEDA